MARTSAKVGLVGLGSMGAGMGSNLIRAGFDLTVCDVRADAVIRMQALGAAAAASNLELGQLCDLIFVVVLDDRQVIDVCIGDATKPGVLQGLRPGSTLAVASTVAPSTHRRVAEAAASHGVYTLDAAMTGGSLGAADATLTFFVGGTAETLERARPALEAMSRQIFHCGGPGSGAVVKLINNFFSISHIAVTREAIRLAQASGIEGDTLLAMVNAGELGSSWVTRNWDRLQRQEENHTTGTAGIAAMSRKDLRLVRDLAMQGGGNGAAFPLLRAQLDTPAPDSTVMGQF